VAIDSRVKRASIAGLALPFMLGVTPDNAKPQEWRQASGYGYSGIAATVTAIPPSDDDTLDNAGNTLTVTTFTDCDGAVVRPPRITFRRAADSVENADLAGAYRADMDRFQIRYPVPPRNSGSLIRIRASTNRAMDALSVRRFRIVGELEPAWPRASTKTATGTDCDGAFVGVPTVRIGHAADSASNGSIRYGSSDSDRFAMRFGFDTDSQVAGHVFRYVFQSDSRMGSAFSIKSFRVHGVLMGVRDDGARST